MKEALVSWTGGMSFNAHLNSGHNVLMDARAEVGGEDKGPRPSELLLAALGGCTGMDVVSILRKMRMEFDKLEVAIEADEAPEHPKAFTDFRMVYRIEGADIDPEKVKKAVQLSEEKYCVVAGLFRHGSKMAYRIEINGEPLA